MVTPDTVASSEPSMASSDTLTAVWMQSIADSCLKSYVAAIARIPELSHSGSRQLITDIGLFSLMISRILSLKYI